MADERIKKNNLPVEDTEKEVQGTVDQTQQTGAAEDASDLGVLSWDDIQSDETDEAEVAEETGKNDHDVHDNDNNTDKQVSDKEKQKEQDPDDTEESDASEDDIDEKDEKDIDQNDDIEEDQFEEESSDKEEEFEEDDLGEEGFEEEAPGAGFYMESEDLEEYVKGKKRKKKKKHNAAKAIGKFFLGLLIFLIVAYLGVSAFFVKHFYLDTKINGTDFSLRSAEDVEKYMTKQVDNYILTLQEVGDAEETIAGSDIDIQYRQSTQIAKELKKQNPFLWPVAFWDPDEINVDIGVGYDEAKLADVIAKLNCMKQDEWTQPTSAQPEYDGEQFVVKPEVFGTTLIPETFNKAVRDTIAGFGPTLNLEEAECYQKPKYVSTSPEVQAACDQMNNYSKASITYKFGDYTEVVDRAVIKDWLTVNIDDMSVQYNEDQVNAYVASLAEKYDTIDKTRTFNAQNGQTYQVRPGTYGWSIDQETEIAALKDSINKGETIEKEPAYKTTARTHTDQDWGDTYAEVSISQQHMWYIQGGAVVFEADVVTGLPTAKKATPTGMHQCLEKAQNKVLRGEIQSNGKPEYETPVAYWMRVTWSGVGFHTATWQPWFGGNRYTYAGSHGCINMSYSDSQTLYGIIQVGDAVIIHE